MILSWGSEKREGGLSASLQEKLTVEKQCWKTAHCVLTQYLDTRKGMGARKGDVGACDCVVAWVI